MESTDSQPKKLSSKIQDEKEEEKEQMAPPITNDTTSQLDPARADLQTPQTSSILLSSQSREIVSLLFSMLNLNDQRRLSLQQGPSMQSIDTVLYSGDIKIFQRFASQVQQYDLMKLFLESCLHKIHPILHERLKEQNLKANAEGNRAQYKATKGQMKSLQSDVLFIKSTIQQVLLLKGF
eukprot:403344004